MLFQSTKIINSCNEFVSFVFFQNSSIIDDIAKIIGNQ